MAWIASDPKGRKLPAQLRKLFGVLVVSFLYWPSAALRAQEVVAEPNLQLFTVLTALNAAGYDARAEKPEVAPLRDAVRQELVGRDIPSREALREFYRSHRLADPAHDLGQYVSLALLLSGPPQFELLLSPANLPPEVLDLREMVPLIAAFYEQADMASLWAKYLPAMEEDSERYRKFLAGAIQEMNGYLRVDPSGFGKRRFAIYPNPLGAPNQTNARSYGDDYFLVIGPSAEMPEEEIRHGWLHFLLDPYPLRYPKVVESKAALQQVVQRAPALDAAFRNSFSLLLTESLIRAIQARRFVKALEGQRQAVREAMEEGLFLTAYFFDAMEVFEQQPVGMYLYYAEMIEAISIPQEQERAAKMQFRPPQKRERNESQWSLREQMFRQGEENIVRGEYEQARQIFEDLLQRHGPDARAYYSLAVVASQQGQPDRAKQYFSQAVTRGDDPRLRAWSHIYLGRLFDLEGNRETALAQYTAALDAGDSSADTRAAAEKGLRERFSPAGRTGSSPLEPEKEEPPRHRVPLGKEGG